MQNFIFVGVVLLCQQENSLSRQQVKRVPAVPPAVVLCWPEKQGGEAVCALLRLHTEPDCSDSSTGRQEAFSSYPCPVLRNAGHWIFLEP